jgi:predicted transcriptional regulator
MHNAEFQKASSLAPFNENTLGIFVGKQKIAVIGEIDLSVTEKLIKKASLWVCNLSRKNFFYLL